MVIDVLVKLEFFGQYVATIEHDGIPCSIDECQFENQCMISLLCCQQVEVASELLLKPSDSTPIRRAEPICSHSTRRKEAPYVTYSAGLAE